MLTLIEKYATAIKWGGLLLGLLAWSLFIWTTATTRTELAHSRSDNGQLKQQLESKDQYLKDYQDLVSANAALRDKLDIATSQNDKLLQERLNANQAATLDLLTTLRDPTRSVYAENSNCGEAGNYPAVFGTTFGPVNPTP